MIEVIDFLQKHWGIIAVVGSAVWTYFWLTMDNKYPRKGDMLEHIKSVSTRIDSVDKKIEQSDDRISTLENKVESLPTLKDFSELQVLMAKIEGEAKSTNASITAISHQVGLLIEDKVLHKKDNS